MILLEGIKTRVDTLRFSPDGQYLAAPVGTGVQVWHDPVRNRQPTVVSSVLSAWVVEFLPGNKLFLGTAWTIRPGLPLMRRHFVRDLVSEEEVDLDVDCHIGLGCWCVPTPDGQRVLVVHERTGGGAATLSVRSIDSPATPLWSATILWPGSAPVFLSGGSHFVLFQKSTIFVRETATGKVEVTVPRKPACQHPVASRDSQMFAGRSRTQAVVFRLDDRKAPPVVLKNESRREVTGLAFHPSGRYLAVTSNDATVKLYDTTTWNVAKVFTWEIGRMRSVAFSHDGMLAAAGGDIGQILVWDFDL
jgi:WD40 repeat protein